jgi:pseudaminic acid synthase
MVDQIREVESQLGEINYSITESAKQSIKGKRSIYVSNFINEGDEINEINIKIVRPSFGLHPKYFEQCIGKKALSDLAPGDRLTKELVEW